jgi:hypothetical protein
LHNDLTTLRTMDAETLRRLRAAGAESSGLSTRSSNVIAAHRMPAMSLVSGRATESDWSPSAAAHLSPYSGETWHIISTLVSLSRELLRRTVRHCISHDDRQPDDPECCYPEDDCQHRP